PCALYSPICGWGRATGDLGVARRSQFCEARCQRATWSCPMGFGHGMGPGRRAAHPLRWLGELDDVWGDLAVEPGFGGMESGRDGRFVAERTAQPPDVPRSLDRARPSLWRRAQRAGRRGRALVL